MLNTTLSLSPAGETVPVKGQCREVFCSDIFLNNFSWSQKTRLERFQILENIRGISWNIILLNDWKLCNIVLLMTGSCDVSYS